MKHKSRRKNLNELVSYEAKIAYKEFTELIGASGESKKLAHFANLIIRAGQSQAGNVQNIFSCILLDGP